MLNAQSDLISRLSQFEDTTVKTSTPDPIPRRLITVRREGGKRLNRLQDRAGIGMFAWAETEAKASALADEIADYMETLSFKDGYDLVTQEAMLSTPDPDTGHPRWYLSYTLITHEPKEG